MSDAPELLPCPFCGDIVSLMVQHLPGTVLHPAYRVACDHCGASTGYSDRGGHVAEWNTRADLAAAKDARIAELERQLAEAREVKPLEWDDNGSADVYRVTFANGQGPKAFLVARGSRIIGWSDDPNEAKAAAQADYTTRILSALKEPKP